MTRRREPKAINHEPVSTEQAAAFLPRLTNLHRLVCGALEDLGRDKWVYAGTVSQIIDEAEDCLVVHRGGMAHSGLVFAVRESTFDSARELSAQVSRPVLKHIFNRTQRAINIINQPRGYEPALYHRQYGIWSDNHKFVPLFC